MSINRWAAKRDDNEPEIVNNLERVGAKVERLKWPCDLAIEFRWHHFLIEVDNPASKYRKRSKKQLETLKKMKIPMVQTSDEALRVIGAMS